MEKLKSKFLVIISVICLIMGIVPCFSISAKAAQVKEVPVYWEYWYDHGGGDGGQGDWFIMSWGSKTVIKRCKDANTARVTIYDTAPSLDNIDFVIIRTYKYSIYDSFAIELRFKNEEKNADLGDIVVELPTTDNRIKSMANGNEYLTINMDRSERGSAANYGYTNSISERIAYRLPADKERTFTASQFTNEEADSVFLGYHGGWSVTSGSANIDSNNKTITLDNCIITKDLYNYGNREKWAKVQVIENNKVVDVYGPERGYEMCFGQKTNGDYATANDSTLINIKGNCELNKPDQLGDYVQPFRIITDSGYKLKIKCEPKSSLKINGYDEYFEDGSELKAFTKEHIELLDNTVFDESTCTIRNETDMASGNSANKPASQSTKTDAGVSMYRLYNPNSGEHFYTANAGEMQYLSAIGWRYEGIGWTAPSTGTPVYRMYNPNVGDHHYTMNWAEVQMLKNAGWNYEGEAWKSGGSVKMLRAYNPNAVTGTHHYTSNPAEINMIVAAGWKDEGYGWYALR